MLPSTSRKGRSKAQPVPNIASVYSFTLFSGSVRGIGDYLGMELQEHKKEKADVWKLKIVQEAKEAGLIASDHNPDEHATKWFVLAVAINPLKKMKS